MFLLAKMFDIVPQIFCQQQLVSKTVGLWKIRFRYILAIKNRMNLEGFLYSYLHYWNTDVKSVAIIGNDWNHAGVAELIVRQLGTVVHN